jgi:glycosyltransferase involved in cell wall biosynthesis
LTARRNRRICVIGSGTRFLSGISYYTIRLTNAFAERGHESTAVLMRQLLPTRFYPGRERVGTVVPAVTYAPEVSLFDGVDWFWLPSMVRALRFLRRRQPEVVVLQWWTGTVLHSYIVLALAARLTGAKVIIEFHEVLDTGELAIKPVAAYVRHVSPVLMRLAHAWVVHSEFDRQELVARYPLRSRPLAIIPHGPYDHYLPAKAAPSNLPVEARPEVVELLYFGVIRPFKGVEDLIAAFDGLSPSEAAEFHLTVVGETWEDWTTPGEMIEKSPYRDRITFVNRYVSDAEAAAFFASTDAVVLPYHRSSASGPLHLAMSHGKPVAVTRVGGLVEVAQAYEGAILVEPQDPDALRLALLSLRLLRDRHFADPFSWTRTVERFEDLITAIERPRNASLIADVTTS